MKREETRESREMRISESGVEPRCIEIQEGLADAKVPTPN